MGNVQDSNLSLSGGSQLTYKAGSQIIEHAKLAGLNPGILYEAVIDLSNEGLYTATCINLAAGILLDDLGLPKYFFENITQKSLKGILDIIAGSLEVKKGKVILSGRVPNADMVIEHGKNIQHIRIGTEDTKDSLELNLGPIVTGHRREYYYSPESNYYTYILKPGRVCDFPKESFSNSKFLFGLSEDFTTTPSTTRKRYTKYLNACLKSVTPLVEVFNLPETGETRIMFNSDFALPQIQILRKMFSERGLVLRRTYWEPYIADKAAPSSICSVYLEGELNRKTEALVIKDLLAFLSWPISGISDLYINGELTFREMLFAGNAVDFSHMFAHRDFSSDRKIMDSLKNADYKDAFANRIHQANKMEFLDTLILRLAKENPDLLKLLYKVFDQKFNPEYQEHITEEEVSVKYEEFKKIISIRFLDYPTAGDIFDFMFKIITSCLKTNFYKAEKRSYAFRFTNEILDPLVFDSYVYGIFFVNGHYASGTHMRAADIARGGLRMIRVTPSNYGSELDKAALLNFALGPKAQRLKHKDICESGSKGVVVPQPIYARCSMEALYDYTEGIMDLILMTNEIVDYLGRPEMIFFGPDEGTAPLMDAVSYQTKARGYKHWRTITTGKSFGIPHDTYGLLENGDVFGLLDHDEKGTELQINGKSIVTTTDMEEIYKHIGGHITISGMTTTSVMTAFRTMIDHYGDKEEELNMIMTGGPDGDLGCNEIQCYKGTICGMIDGGSILFDPNGLDKKELMKIGFMRHTKPRENTLAYPAEKLSTDGFMVPRLGKNITLPDGTFIEDGAIFHKNFLTDPDNRSIFKKADIKVFIPCGGFKDTVNSENVTDFMSNFKELKYITEGANVFFDDSARRRIAQKTDIKQIKDSSANKGGVFSSSMAEVQTAFLFGKEYESYMLEDLETRWALIKNIMNLIEKYTHEEISLIIKKHEQNPENALFQLSVSTSEDILALQDELQNKIDEIEADKELEWKILESYIPETLVQKLGRERITATLNSPQLIPYRNAILTKKIASTALYQHGLEWNEFLKKIKADFIGTVKKVF
jgi:glutamate dehydrogenase